MDEQAEDLSIARERLTQAMDRWIKLGAKVRELAADLQHLQGFTVFRQRESALQRR